MKTICMDKLSLERAQLLHPAVRYEAISLLAESAQLLTGNAMIRYAYTLRTFEEQKQLFNQRPKVTNADAGQSFHNYGLAFDIVLIVDGKTASWDTLKDFDGDKQSDWMEFVTLAKHRGWTWGGDFKSIVDKPHFEKTFGHTWQDLLKKYNSKDFIPGTKYVNL